MTIRLRWIEILPWSWRGCMNYGSARGQSDADDARGSCARPRIARSLDWNNGDLDAFLDRLLEFAEGRVSVGRPAPRRLRGDARPLSPTLPGGGQGDGPADVFIARD